MTFDILALARQSVNFVRCVTASTVGEVFCQARIRVRFLTRLVLREQPSNPDPPWEQQCSFGRPPLGTASPCPPTARLADQLKNLGSPYFLLGTLMDLIASLSMGATRSWIAASWAEAKCPWRHEGHVDNLDGSSPYRIPWRGRYLPSTGAIQPRRRAKRNRSLALLMEMPRVLANSREV
jgi:hypothetical protein